MNEKDHHHYEKQGYEIRKVTRYQVVKKDTVLGESVTEHEAEEFIKRHGEPLPAKDTLKVLPNGTKVKCVCVDHNGYCGRDNHPQDSDIGQEGVIIENECMIDGGRYGDHDSCPAGYEIDADSDSYICYIVQMANGQKLDLMWFEVQVVD